MCFLVCSICLNSSWIYGAWLCAGLWGVRSGREAWKTHCHASGGASCRCQAFCWNGLCCWEVGHFWHEYINFVPLFAFNVDDSCVPGFQLLIGDLTRLYVSDSLCSLKCLTCQGCLYGGTHICVLIWFQQWGWFDNAPDSYPELQQLSPDLCGVWSASWAYHGIRALITTQYVYTLLLCGELDRFVIISYQLVVVVSMSKKQTCSSTNCSLCLHVNLTCEA